MSNGNTLAGSEKVKRTNVRADADLLDDLDETIEATDRWDSRSEWFRDMARRTAEDGTERDGLVPPDKEHLARAYQLLLDVGSPGGYVPLDDATTLLADQNTPKKAVERRLLRPLQRRGYIRITSDLYGQQKSIEVRGAE